MKWVVIAVLCLRSLTLSGQSEFASSGFYDDFRKFYADAKQGFMNYRGAWLDSGTAVLSRAFAPLLMLPLADSGRIVVPEKGLVYAEFIFEPSRSRLKIDQRATDLRDAILVSVGHTLYCRTETFMVEGKPITNTWLFDDAGETRNSNAAFRISIYYNEGMYFISLIMKGPEVGP